MKWPISAAARSGGSLPRLADQLDHELERGEVALGAAALEAELGGHLLPALAVLADQHVVGHQAVLEVHLVEVVAAGQVDDRADRDAGGLEIHQELGEALVLLVRHHLGAEERDRVVGEVRVARPDLGAVDLVAARDLLGPRADGGQVRARVRLAHPDGEGQLAARDPRQEALALLLGAEAEQQRAALAVGHPVRAHRRARGQGLLEHHVALQRGALVAAVLLGPRHADPAALAHPAREVAVEPAPGARALRGPVLGHLGLEEGADLVAQRFCLGGKRGELEVECRHNRDPSLVFARLAFGCASPCYRKRDRAMTMRCTSDGPSPMRRTRASRYQRSSGNSLDTP